MDSVEILIDLLNEIEERKKKITKKLVIKSVVELLNKGEKLTHYYWNQYAPYFNDGDPCYFSVNACSDYLFDYYDEDDEESIGYNQEDLSKHDLDILDKIGNLLTSIDKDLMEAFFESSSEITITREGNVTIEYYEHD